MRNVNFSRSEAGFTLQELLVVMAASAILFSLSMTLYGFVTRLVTKAAREDELREAVEQTLRRVVADIEHAKEAVAQSDSTLEITRTDGRRIMYASSRGVLLRNEDTLGLPGKVSLWLKSTRIPETKSGSNNPLQLEVEVVGKSLTSVYSASGKAALPWSSTASIHEAERLATIEKSSSLGNRP